MKKNFKSLSVLILAVFAVFLLGGCNWMSGNFFSSIEDDVKVANAEVLQDVYVRFADTKMGTTAPNGATSEFKVGVKGTVSSVTNTEYGFKRWAAFKQGTDKGATGTDFVFDVSKQNTNLYYKDAESYEKDFKPAELSEDIIKFDDAENATTDFVIYKNPGYKIAIVPIVAKRPEYVQSVPYNGKSNVVTNQTIRILFSKKILEESLEDNVRVTSGYAVITEDMDDVEAVDITEKFDIKLSASQKLLTLKLKNDAEGNPQLMNANAQISITLYSDITDTDGYKMAENTKITFTVGSSRDSLAPVIQELKGGIKGYAQAFSGLTCKESEKPDVNMGETNEDYINLYDEAYLPTITEAAKPALYNQIFRQRVTDHVNLYVKAGDLAGFGANMQGYDLSPQDVATVSAKSELVMKADGNVNPFGTTTILANSRGYTMGGADKSFTPKITFEEATGDNSGLGTLFTYDVSTLPDGLIRIDVWACDMVGNTGNDEAYWNVYGNGYRSIYVTKDTTAPVVTASQIKTSAEGADGNWYNKTTFASIKAEDNGIKDSNDARLSSKKEDLKWIFKLNPPENWAPKATDEGWCKVVDGYSFTEAKVSTQGLVNIKMAVMDDMGNISTPVALSEVYYDDVAPAASSIAWTAITGTPGMVKGNLLTDQTLNIGIKEVTSGVKKVKIEVTKENPVDKSYAASTASPLVYENAEISLKLNGTEIEKSYYINTDEGKIAKPTYTITADTITFADGYEIKSTGNDEAILSITGIKINDSGAYADCEGKYEVKAILTDRSKNSTTVSENKKEIYNDSTAPVITKVYIPNIKKAKAVVPAGATDYPITDAETDDKISYWIDSEYVGGNHGSNYCATNVPLYITINENNSGVQVIYLGQNFHITSSSKLYTVAEDGTETEVPASAIKEISTSGNYIKLNAGSQLTNNKDKADFTVKISNLKLDNHMGTKDEEDKLLLYNLLSVTAEDLALNVSNPVAELTLDDNSKTNKVSVDSWNPGFTDPLTLSDRENTLNKIAADASYTNDETVNLSVYVTAENTASGINQFILTGATFTENTKVSACVAGKTATENIPYVLSEDKKTLSLKEGDVSLVFRATLTVSFTNILLDSAAEGSHTVNVDIKDAVGWISGNSTSEHKKNRTGSITIDKTAPSFSKDGNSVQLGPVLKQHHYYGEGSSDFDAFMYPHPTSTSTGVAGLTAEELGNTAELNGDSIPVRYFYANSSVKIKTDSGYKKGIFFDLVASDNTRLKGKSYYYVYEHTTAAKDNPANINAASVINGGYYPTQDSRGNSFSGTTSGSSVFFCEAGKYYSFVLVDAAGNYSSAATVKVLEDGTKPALTAGADESKTLNDLMTLIVPDKARVFRYATLKSSSNSSDFYYFDNGPHEASVCTKRYYIKGGNDNYKVVVKLGSGTTASDVQLDGTAAETVSGYNDSKLSKTSSGLEYYAISHWLGNWLAEEKTTDHAFEPAFPYGTVTPDGSLLREYFGFWNNTNSSWQAISGYNSWHPYKQGVYTDKATSGSSSDYAIKSEIDSNGDLIIYIPNKTHTPPLSLLLKDGCGNLNYVFIRPSSMAVGEVCKDYNQVSWYVDSGISAPYVYPNTHKWTNDGSYIYGDSSYKFNKTMNDSSDSRSIFNIIMRDLKKEVTYYNNNAYVTLRNINETSNYLFDFTFPYSGTLSYRGNWKGDETNYSVRANLLATKKESVTYEDFLTATTSNSSGWYSTKLVSSSSCPEIVLPYPRVDYEALGWEPTDPYYVYYIVEDAVGNYNIEKIRNDYNIKYFKFLYDNEAPKITVRGTSTSPSSISLADISTLVPDNNNFRSWANGGTGYIASSGETEYTSKYGTITLDTGTGTTRHVEGARESTTDSRIHLPFFDIEVNNEATGIRAFAYTTSSDSPGATAPVSDENTQGDNGVNWYAGYGAIQIDAEIGCGHTYSTDHTNAYDQSAVYAAGSSYYYTGTKVNTVMPYGLLKEDEAKPVYLHVMDWLGNIATYKMGNFNWKKDITLPVNISDAVIAYEEDYYITKNKGSCDGKITIAGLSEAAKNGEKIKVYLPDGWYTDGGSGVYGWALTSGTSQYADNPALVKFETDSTSSKYGKSYIELDPTVYSDKAGSATISVFDGVGNSPKVSYTVVKDTEAPSLNVRVSTANTKPIFLPPSGTRDITSFAFDTISSSNKLSTETAIKAGAQTVYSQEKNFNFTVTSSDTGLKSISVMRWDGSKWVEVASCNNELAWKTSAWGSQKASDVGNWNVSGDTYKTTITIEDGYYQVSISDFSGNTNYKYFNLITDEVAPTWVKEPVLTPVVGAINKNPSNNHFYFNSIKLGFQASDATSGLFDYYISKSTINLAHTTLNSSPVELDMNENADYLKVLVRDNVMNSIEEYVKYNGEKVTNLTQDTIQPETPSARAVYDAASGNYSASSFKTLAGDTEKLVYDYDADNNTLELTNYYINRIQYTPECTSKDVMGYLELSSPLAAGTKAGNYSASDVKTTFEHSCSYGPNSAAGHIQLNGNTYTYYYYAVDYAGNISAEPFKLNYKFSQNSVPSVDEVTCTTTLKTLLDTGAYSDCGYSSGSFTNAGGSIVQIDDVNYAANVQLAVRCSLKKNEDKFNPKRLTVYLADSYDSEKKQLVNGSTVTEWRTSDKNQMVRYISSSKNSNNRYLCLVVIPNFVNYQFNTNKKKVYITLSADTGTSDYYELSYKPDGAASASSVWEIDTASDVPYVNGTVGKMNKASTNVVTTDLENFWFKDSSDSITINYSGVKDNASGLYGYAVNSTSFADAVPGNDVTFTNLSTGSVKVYAFDKVGHVSTNPIDTITFKQDSTGPEISSVTPGFEDSDDNTLDSDHYFKSGDSYYFNSSEASSVNFTINATDSESGVRGFKYKAGDGEYTKVISTSVTIDVPSSETTYTFVSIDAVGNESSESTITLIPDGEGPAGGAVSFAFTDNSNGDVSAYVSDSYYNKDKVTKLKLTVNTIPLDSASGLKGYYYYSSKTSQTSSMFTGTETTIDLSESTTYTVYAVDKVGNTATVGSMKVTRDGVAPVAATPAVTVASVSAKNPAGADYLFYNASSVMTSTITETGSGLAYYGFSMNANNEPASWTEVGSKLSSGTLSVNLSEADSIIGSNTTDTPYLWVKDKVGYTGKVAFGSKLRPLVAVGSLDYSATMNGSAENNQPKATYTVTFAGSLNNAVKAITVTVPNISGGQAISSSNVSVVVGSVSKTNVAGSVSINDRTVTFTCTNPIMSSQDFTITIVRNFSAIPSGADASSKATLSSVTFLNGENVTSCTVQSSMNYGLNTITRKLNGVGAAVSTSVSKQLKGSAKTSERTESVKRMVKNVITAMGETEVMNFTSDNRPVETVNTEKLASAASEVTQWISTETSEKAENFVANNRTLENAAAKSAEIVEKINNSAAAAEVETMAVSAPVAVNKTVVRENNKTLIIMLSIFAACSIGAILIMVLKKLLTKKVQ